MQYDTAWSGLRFRESQIVLEPNTELMLRDMSRRLLVLMEQVKNGELVDTVLLEKLNEISELVFLKYQSDQSITDEELELMTDLICLLEMRTTLIYKNPPKD
jgi:hypothetical protein